MSLRNRSLSLLFFIIPSQVFYWFCPSFIRKKTTENLKVLDIWLYSQIKYSRSPAKTSCGLKKVKINGDNKICRSQNRPKLTICRLCYVSGGNGIPIFLAQSTIAVTMSKTSNVRVCTRGTCQISWRCKTPLMLHDVLFLHMILFQKNILFIQQRIVI